MIGDTNGTLVAAFADGAIGLLSHDANGDYSLAGDASTFIDQASALEVLQGANGMEVYVTREGSDIPLILAGADFIPVATQLPEGTVIAQSISLPNEEIVLVAILLTGSTRDLVADDTDAVVSDVAFASFSPAFSFQVAASGEPGAASASVLFQVPPSGVAGERSADVVIVPVPFAGDAASRPAAWESFRSGVEEAFQRQSWLRQSEHLSEDALQVLRHMFDQIQQWLHSEAVRRRGAGAAPFVPWPTDDGSPTITRFSGDDRAEAMQTELRPEQPPGMTEEQDPSVLPLAFLLAPLVNPRPCNARPRRRSGTG